MFLLRKRAPCKTDLLAQNYHASTYPMLSFSIFLIRIDSYKSLLRLHPPERKTNSDEYLEETITKLGLTLMSRSVYV